MVTVVSLASKLAGMNLIHRIEVMLYSVVQHTYSPVIRKLPNLALVRRFFVPRRCLISHKRCSSLPEARLRLPISTFPTHLHVPSILLQAPLWSGHFATNASISPITFHNI